MPMAQARYRSLVPICIAKWRTRHIRAGEDYCDQGHLTPHACVGGSLSLGWRSRPPKRTAAAAGEPVDPLVILGDLQGNSERES
jgi:hypothetical protein